MRRIILLTLTAASLIAADATGKWTGTLTITSAEGNGRPPGPAHLVLKQEGAKLTGTAGPDENQQAAIENGKAEDGTLTFELPTGGGPMKFALKHDGDEIKGDVTGEREGQKRTGTLAVKREK